MFFASVTLMLLCWLCPTASIQVLLQDNAPQVGSFAALMDTSSERSGDRKFTSLDNNELEPMCRPDPKRFALYPIKTKSMWDMYKKHIASFWTVEEVDLSMDMHDWKNKLNDDERHFIQMILAFFAGCANRTISYQYSQSKLSPDNY